MSPQSGRSGSVSVVVMAYDERNSLEAVVRELHEVLAASGREFELLVIDDGSRDGTSEAADALAGSLAGVRVIHHPANLGLGGVYRTGFAQSRCDLLSFFSADGQFPAAILEGFLPAAADCDLVLGYLPKRRDPFMARVLSGAERLAYRLLLGPMPRFQGVFLIRRELLGRLELTSHGRGWAVVMEMVLKAARSGARIKSLPTSLRPRMAGQSKVRNTRTALENLRQVVELAWRVRAR